MVHGHGELRQHPGDGEDASRRGRLAPAAPALGEAPGRGGGDSAAAGGARPAQARRAASATSRTMSSAFFPAASAWKFTTIRCRSTGERHRVEVLEVGHRPAVHRRARLRPEHQVLRRPAARRPRPRTPSRSSGASASAGRVIRASFTAACTTTRGAGTRRTSPISSSSSSPDSTGSSAVAARPRRPLDDLLLLLARRVLDVQLEHEPVELRLGQRIRPFLLDRVLRGQHEERLGEPVGLARRPSPRAPASPAAAPPASWAACG